MALIGFILVLVTFITTFCQRRSAQNKNQTEAVLQESRKKRKKKFIDENLQEEVQVKTQCKQAPKRGSFLNEIGFKFNFKLA